ncbi:glyoxylate/hydroxypyruvate reductase A-like isoform X2 [Ptychodera flava]|uniref:glyoxylate/hydroxypyruvate reductase A-like isoform X2 n=1 Tax=Ptychodera flava TaxID=63121 RepID=UPI00396A70E9
MQEDARKSPAVTLATKVARLSETLAAECHDTVFRQVHFTRPKSSGELVQLQEADIQILRETEVLVCENTFVRLFPSFVKYVPKLKWMHYNVAGIDSIFKAWEGECPPHFIITRSPGFSGIEMADYVIGHVIARERKFKEMARCQEDCIWNTEFCNFRRVSELTIGILGVGDIGSQIAKQCKNHGMTVWGLVKHEHLIRERTSHVDVYKFSAELEQLLAECDYICNVLPSTSSTRGLLSGKMLSACAKKKSVFINIGRGDIIDEESIVSAIRNGWISAAILDVLPVEPLPATSQLWKMPEVTITPHMATCFHVPFICQRFKDNYQKFVRGEEMNHVVSWQSEY